MTKPQRIAQIRKPALKNIVLADLAVSLSAVIVCLLLNPALLLPLVLGFGVFFVPMLFFVWRSYRYTGARYARQVAQSLYIAELGKFTLTLSLLAMIFLMLPPQNYFLMFAAYLGLWLVHQIAAFYWVGK